MRCGNATALCAALAVAMLVGMSGAGCAHRIQPELEPRRVASALGFAECDVSEPMRRYQVLDLADRRGNPALADSPEWAAAMSMMQPGDELRHVDCRRTGVNFFGVFRDKAVLFEFGSFLF